MTENLSLTVVERNDFLVFQEGSYAAEAMAANMDGSGFSEQDLIQVRTPTGGAKHWTVPGPKGEQIEAFIEGVIVFRCLKGVLFPTEEMSKDIPVLVSDDMKVGTLRIPFDDVPEDMQLVLIDHELTEAEIRSDKRYANVPASQLPRLFHWDGPNKIPYCEFGSTQKKDAKGNPRKGKRAKDKQVLFILKKDAFMPIRMELGPTSIKPVKTFMMQNDMPYYRFFTRIGLQRIDDANPYSVITLERTEDLSRDCGDDIVSKYHKPLKAMHDAGKLNMVTADQE